MKALLALALLGAQDPVRVACCLPAPATRVVDEHLGRELGLPQFTLLAKDPVELELAVRERRADFDVVVGLDAVACERLAAGGCWSMQPFEGGTVGYWVPWVAPLAIATSRAGFGGELPPKSFADLAFDARLRSRIALVHPDGMPSLWISWLQATLRQGHGLVHGMAWLRALDTNVGSYEPSAKALLARLAAGEAGIGILTVGEIRAHADTLDLVTPEEGYPGQCLTVAVVAAPRLPVEAAHVAQLLLLPALTRSLAAVDVLPALADDQDRGSPLAESRTLRAKLWPCQPAPDAERWLTQWRTEVQGKGQRLDAIETGLDFAFLAVFVAFLIVMHRRTRSP